MKFLVFLWALLLAAPAFAQNTESPKPIGLSGWKIGLSNSLHMTAPENLRAGGVAWDVSTPILFSPTNWSAENDSVRVEIVRGALARFDDLRKAAFTRVGNATATGRNFQLDTYHTSQHSEGGKTATVVKHGNMTWAIVVLPGKTADARAVSDDIVQSIWLERIEKPEWKDRVAGYSFQADLPYEMAEAVSASKTTEYYRARWGDFSIETLKGGAYTDFDATVNNQVEAMRKRTDIKDVRVQRFAREFGYLAKERGVAVQLDFLRGEMPHRIYKIATVTGFGGIFTTISLRPKNPTHLYAAHRILSTLRLGYGVPGDTYQTVSLPDEVMAFESRSGFRAPTGDEEFKAHIGQDERHFVFMVGHKTPLLPLVGEMKTFDEFARDTALGGFFGGMKAKLQNVVTAPYAAGAFPARRLRFEAESKNNRLHGDALAIVASHRIVIPFYITGTASSDAMPRLSSTLRWSFPSPANWQQQNAGASGFQILLPKDIKPVKENGKWSVEFDRDGVHVFIEELPTQFRDEIYLSLDGLTTGERADNPIETHYGSLLRLKNRMENNYGFHWARTSIGEAHGVAGWGAGKDLSKQQDGIVLQNSTHSWLCEVTWNARDPKSCATRDAVLGSIHCDSTAIATLPANTPTPTTPTPDTPAPSTPAPANETDDWGWWF